MGWVSSLTHRSPWDGVVRVVDAAGPARHNLVIIRTVRVCVRLTSANFPEGPRNGCEAEWSDALGSELDPLAVALDQAAR